ncbi:MAG: hypothetical protein WC997_04145 [Porticoccaceae bacterium]
MSVSRRFVLKGMALSSIAGFAAGGPLRALAGTVAIPAGIDSGAPLLALVDGSTAEQPFLHGALAGGGNRVRMQRVNHDLDVVLAFERQLRSVQPLRVIGLLDDAAATLVVDMARSAGAQVLWLGQHSTDTRFSRHRLMTTAAAANCSREFTSHLRNCGASVSLNEEQGDGTAIRQLAHPAQDSSRAGQWLATIGYLLAALDNPNALAAPAALPLNKPVTGSFVSFAIEA